MALVAEGLTNAEIGERLFMSPATARTHVSRILDQLGARDRTQLVVMAYESGLVRPGMAGLIAPTSADVARSSPSADVPTDSRRQAR